MRISGLTDMNTIMTSLETTKEENQTSSFQNVLSQAMQQEDDKQLKKACQEVESYLLADLFKQMKASTESEEGIFEKGDYEKIFESQLIDEQTKMMVQAGGIGLADSMYRQLSQTNSQVVAAASAIDTKL
jgi:flagellar protein FlgJ